MGFIFVNPKSTGLVGLGKALRGGCFPPHSVKFDPDNLED